MGCTLSSQANNVSDKVLGSNPASKAKNQSNTSSSTSSASLTPDQIVAALQERGWQAEIVTEFSLLNEMVDVDPQGILKCVDGRGSDNTQFCGPKMPGGIYAIAHNRGVTTLEGLKQITKEVASKGHVPSVHGDHSSDMLGCGFFKLWVTGRFDDMGYPRPQFDADQGAKAVENAGGVIEMHHDLSDMLGCGFFKLWVTGRFDDMGYPRPQFDADQGAKAVENAGGVIEMHHGSHAEKVVYINLVENKTLEPDEDDQRFIVDGWAAGKFGLDVPKFLIAAAATVEMLGGPKKAKIVIPSISPAQIAEALQGRGWDAEIVTDASMAGQLVDVRPEGILKCVDGRGSDNTRMGGPKMPGGIYAIAHNRGVTSIEGLKQITKEVASKGHLPSVHGDHSSDMLGCGFFKLWVTGRFDDMGYPRPQFDADQGANAVKDAGGIIEMHHGSHTEKVVYINLLANKTLEPNENDQRFIVDGWAADKFGLDVPKFLIAAAATVEMLGGPKNAKIVVPSITPPQIVSALRGRGWKASIVKASTMSSELKRVDPQGILKCVDGRGSDNTQFGGPKMPGGIYAIAHNRGVTTLEGLKDITREVASKGHVPSVHGDHSSDMLGCGFFKLWLTGRFDDMGYPRPEFDADQGALAVRAAGGVIEMHHGSHEEKVVYINLVSGMTLEPNEHDQRFIVDGWAASKFGLDVVKFLVAAAATVEMLGGPKKAKIVIP
eukprot:CAMPEP_0171415778 /NCGR_PEP_ID=MMETSP0880-20121228/39755_1 /TAXON_ID=67004 /ORGANISM="Thalassiosira weissflogii, Strain CCMP1336" /LENGTH=717 /DNA_ID=CAMNT_0011934009 /DNA_START=123 /DNA_END=2277 /DNA_ORIENTATION=-